MAVSSIEDLDHQAVLLKQVAQSFQLMTEQMPAYDDRFFRLDARITQKAIGNALRDLQRWAVFHQEGSGELPDRHKYAGFISRWIAKEKPVQVIAEVPLDRQPLKSLSLWINPILSVYVLQSFLQSRIPVGLSSYLRYWFAFRDERADAVAMIAFLMERVSLAETPTKSS